VSAYGAQGSLLAAADGPAAQAKAALGSQFPTLARMIPHPCTRGQTGRARQTFSNEQQKNSWSLFATRFATELDGTGRDWNG
jgi:hypothetical protein